MSLILEALRKSEAERRRGVAPDLRTELPPVAAARRAPVPRWAWAWMGTALALLVLVAAWLLAAHPWDTEVVATVDPSIAPTPAAATPAGPRVGGPAPARIPADAGIAPDPGDWDPGPETADASGRAAASGAPAPVTGPQPASPQGSVPAQVASSMPAPALPPPPPAPAPAAAAETSPTTQATASGARLLALSELSTEERRQLPPLKLSMHMWSEDPARRFVILDGQRLAEGDRAGPAVVDAIRSDDVLLAWNGMRLRLSLR